MKYLKLLQNTTLWQMSRTSNFAVCKKCIRGFDNIKDIKKLCLMMSCWLINENHSSISLLIINEHKRVTDVLKKGRENTPCRNHQHGTASLKYKRWATTLSQGRQQQVMTCGKLQCCHFHKIFYNLHKTWYINIQDNTTWFILLNLLLVATLITTAGLLLSALAQWLTFL